MAAFLRGLAFARRDSHARTVADRVSDFETFTAGFGTLHFLLSLAVLKCFHDLFIAVLFID